MSKDVLKILVKRIASSLVILFLMISFLFVLLRISPGDPSQKFISPVLSPELASKVRESFDLNNSVAEQYKSFIINLAHGDFGISYNYRIPVVNVIEEYLPFTLIFSFTSFVIQIAAALFLSLISVKKINGSTDKTISLAALIIYALPSFVIGVILIFLFSETLDIFPSSGLSSFGSGTFSLTSRIGDYITHLILPLITLSLGGVAVFYKYLRDNLEDIYNKPFVMNLRSYGVPEKVITKKHAIPNAISPLIAIAGIELGILFSGSLITEVIFGLPGMGRLTISAIFTRDYPLVIGCTFIAGVLIIFTNLAADLFKAKMDKRLLLKGILN